MTKETLPDVAQRDNSIAPMASPSSYLDNMFTKIRETGLVRTQERWCAGVAGGVARRMGWDPTLVRGILFVSTFLTGLGLVLYGLGWALLPEEFDGRIHLQEAIRGRFDPALLGAGLLVLMGFGRNGGAGSALGHGFAVITNAITTALLVFGIVYVVRLVKERKASEAVNFPVGTSAGQVPMSTSPRSDLPVAENVVAQAVIADADLENSITNPGYLAATEVEATKPEPTKHEQHRQEHERHRQEREAWRYARAVEKAKKPIVKGPGVATTGGAFGAILLLVATAMAIGQTHLPYSPTLMVGAVLALLGSVIVISGFRGRRGGLLNLFSILALMAIPVTAAYSVASDALTPGNGLFANSSDAGAPEFGGAMRVVDGDIVVANRVQAERGFQIGFGDPVIDLSDVDLDAEHSITVPISLRAGDLTIVVPDDAAVGANIRLLAGEINWEIDEDAHESLSQVGRGRTELQSEEVRDDEPELLLWINAGVGNVTIREGH